MFTLTAKIEDSPHDDFKNTLYVSRTISCLLTRFVFCILLWSVQEFDYYKSMKTRFSTYDLTCIITELKTYIGLRVNQVYDIDNKTYLIRLQKTDEKVIILLESGNRIHTTSYEWPKNPAPSGFSMKLRKHLRNKRLESVSQLGIDRIIDLTFGSGEAAHHLFLELFDRGNMILTDYELTALYVLRPVTQNDRYKFAVREKYPVDKARLKSDPPNVEQLREILLAAQDGDHLKKILTPKLEYGPALIEHVLLGIQLSGNSKIGKDVVIDRDVDQLIAALQEAESIMAEANEKSSEGVIIQKEEKRPLPDGGLESMFVNTEFHPMLFRQHADSPYVNYDSFNKAVDVFYSSMEGQKIEMKIVQQERDALKKLENVRRDHSQRLQQLEMSKETDKIKAELITKNRELVDQAVLGVRTALANQIAWPEIQSMVKLSASQGDPVAKCIKDLKLDINHIILQLTDPFSDESGESDEETQPAKSKKPVFVDIDLDLSAFANARRYYDQKRSATKKQQKTIESQTKALKSAEKKTKKSLQEMKTIVNITKARKVFWFEKFFWFISSENYLVIGGRDATQNELVVKRYMRAGDVYVHADIHGASSIVIKNPTKEPIPPKTLNEAGIMAICYSAAWEAKVLTNAWWVYHDQVLKSAPSGEYLATGSFSIRGKKNYLPPSNFVLGFGFLFKLEENSVSRHADERKVKSLEEEVASTRLSTANVEEVELVISDGDDEEEKEENEGEADSNILETVTEETEETEELNQSSCSSDDDGPEKETQQDCEVGPDDNNEEDDDDNFEEGKESNIDVADNKKSAESAFPDTEIKFHHKGKEMSLETKPSNLTSRDEQEEELVVYLGDDKPVVIKRQEHKQKPVKGKKKPQEVKKPEDKPHEAEKPKEEPRPKRGQKSKLKKIKEKYKDQDEEDKRLRMEFLQAAGSKKKNSKKEKKKEAEKQAALQKNRPKLTPQPRVKDKGSGDESDEEAAETATAADTLTINSLTGIPHPDDELLFAVPVVAPYNTLQNYKFKVKIMPGTTKRGKGARTALAVFLKDKLATQRERNLLKGVKDEDLARNFPGKVKISTHQQHK